MGIDGAPLVENVFYREHEDRIVDRRPRYTRLVFTRNFIDSIIRLALKI